ncbi:ImmA/IrrE family metallo-endopeptidase [Clostridium perfringens]|uniref:ImmA/IrrE family metallo-endopeptidase n=1 Tax=Clostridium perfringens TaxID=1502 RepID=UPI0013E3EBD1|nr:ImmA/IrrE family metallo-endopeptidase [Clostridium perfringens]EJT6614896.1 ImmA/IrrE family metallo-endopeptidase [Clostridium perfringens]MBI5977636.1 ImmA/IrrE family metallo-endopeptidase [Clostridium perfringens]MBI5980536.1 ImmA/IrrE family metallo-endopeptidase [Clostridium perfringens]MBO3320117.1 ImmA/IrrE family metallo-endopeptidase [Clostridium perfringens]MDK0760464.1 ImmA/IrrE family metallo-endopeptidase [Clostridium perfringens]
MDNKIIDKARRFLGIDNYPGNLFTLFDDTERIIKEKKIVLFKEDIDKLSGFIGYNNQYTIICINYKRSIGHQNFTLAHELGHMFLHIGKSMSDSNPETSGGGFEEHEANLFAKELLYPNSCVENDIKYVLDEDLLSKENWNKLADYIDRLCCKYCTSFKFTFNRLLENQFSTYNVKKEFYNKFKKSEIGKFDYRFPKTSFMYNVKEEHEFYKPNYEPYKYMKMMIEKLIEENELGLETGEAMVERYRELEGNK